MANNRTSLKIDKIDSENLAALANHESRTKVDEFRFLIKERAKELGLKLKWQ
jgi:hypothetical protein